MKRYIFAVLLVLGVLVGGGVRTASAATPTVTTDGSDVTSRLITLKGSIKTNGARQIGGSFEYGETTSYGGNVSASISILSDQSYTATLDPYFLKPNTTYHYRARVDALIIDDKFNGGKSFGSDMIFTTEPLSHLMPTLAYPVVQVRGRVSDTPYSVHVVSAIDPQSPSSNISALGFEYGTTTAYGRKIIGGNLWANVPGALRSFDAVLNGLAIHTTYHIRAYLTDVLGNTTYSNDTVFTTSSVGSQPFYEVGGGGLSTSASNTSATASTFTGRLNGDGPGTIIPIEVGSEYGTTPSYGFKKSLSIIPGGESSPSMSPFWFSASVTGLSCNTLYYVKAYAAPDSFPVTHGDVANFTTLPCTTTLPTSRTKVTLQGATCTVDILPQGSYKGTTVGTSCKLGDIAGPNIVKNINTYFSTAFSSTTGTAPTLTTTAAGSITQTSATVNGNLTNLGGASSVTTNFDYGKTTTYGSTTPVATKTATGSLSATLTGLTCNTLYHYRASATSTKGTGKGIDMTFTTSACSVASTLPTLTTKAVNFMSGKPILQGSLDTLGTWKTPITVGFQYGASTAYGMTTNTLMLNAVGSTTSASPLVGITTGFTTHYRIFARNSAGEYAYGKDMTFVGR